MSKSTMVEMVVELKKLPPYGEVLAMIKEAEAGEFHDYKNQKYACGKFMSAVLLKNIADKYPDCRDLALKIREDIIEGEYDEDADDEDKIRIANDINTSNMPPGQKEAMKKMLGLQDNVKNGPWGKRYF